MCQNVLFQHFEKFASYLGVIMSGSTRGRMYEEDYQRYLSHAEAIFRFKVQDLASNKLFGLVLYRASQSASRKVNVREFVEEVNMEIKAALMNSDSKRHITTWIWFPEGTVFCLEGLNLIDIKIFRKEGSRVVTVPDYHVERQVRRKNYKA